ncbi:terminase large subunit [Paenibacillus thailandensis]|uniref:Terminase large subunit n=1 Tax=Paenibacillus thailandensis TaxID=393250 RepID=A0ABW5R3C0_9BACL
MINEHKSYRYALSVVNGDINAPKYVILQCQDFLNIANGKSDKYIIDQAKVNLIDTLLKLMNMAKGLNSGDTVYNSIAGFQSFFIIAILCTVHRDNINRRRYETAILEICRKNGKTWLIGIIFLLLFLLEPKFSKFYSVAPDGSLSREVKEAIKETIAVSPALAGNGQIKSKFKIRRDDIECLVNSNKYIPLNYSTSRLDGKLPSVFLVDETGALPNPYAIEAMRSGQLTILNKLGCVISTKYPTFNNPFEDEVSYAKKVLDRTVVDDKVFALLYEPDNTKDWMTDDKILEQANPLALEVPEIMESLLSKRQVAIEVSSKRENFVTKHCNIIYQGIGTESYIDVSDLQECKVDKINWSGRNVYIGLDLSLTTDNTSYSMVALDKQTGHILADSYAFIPEDRIEDKIKSEREDYYEHIKSGKCFACEGPTVSYNFIENMIMEIEEKFDVRIMGIGYDRSNCLSTAQKLEAQGLPCTMVRQHSDTLHPPTKLLQEYILNKQFEYEENKLLEVNFQNAKVTEDTNLRKYVNKKKSNGKVDMVVSLINAIYVLQQEELLNDNFVFQFA